MAVGDPGAAGHQGEVAVEHQLEPAGRRHPVDEGHHRDREIPQPSEHPVDVGHEAGEGDRIALQLDVTLEVASGAEGPTGPREQHATQVALAGEVVEDRVELSQHLPVDGVQAIRPGQGEHGRHPRGARLPGSGPVPTTGPELNLLDHHGRFTSLASLRHGHLSVGPATRRLSGTFSIMVQQGWGLTGPAPWPCMPPAGSLAWC